MTSAKLAIDGGAPLRSQPFGPKWIFGDEERRHLMEVMDNATDGWRSGFKVRAFADAFATLHGAQYAVATTTGTGAIHAAVAAVNPEPGDEVITTATTDIGSVLGIILHNAIPVFADWDPETLNTDPADVERRITPRTRRPRTAWPASTGGMPPRLLSCPPDMTTRAYTALPRTDAETIPPLNLAPPHDSTRQTLALRALLASRRITAAPTP